jgi:hypothetical protein
MVVHVSNPNYSGDLGRRITGQSQSQAKKIAKAKRAEGMAQAVENPPNKCEALSSNPILPKLKTKKIL